MEEELFTNSHVSWDTLYKTIKRSIKEMRYFPQQVPLCTTGVHDP